MKNVPLLIIAASICSITTFAQSVKSNVRKVEGVPVYILSEPDAEYTVVGKVTDQDAVSVLNAISGTPTIRSIIEQAKIILANAQRKQKKGKIGEFDAIIIDDDGHLGSCIKFKK
jgi:hypothetical protein